MNSMIVIIMILIVVASLLVADQKEDNCLPAGFEYHLNQLEKSGDCYLPDDGVVPDEETAIKIAEAVLYPILGEELNQQKPFNVCPSGDSAWVVYGRLRDKLGAFHVYPISLVKIRISDGAIICFGLSE